MDESTPAAPADPSSPLDVVRSALPGILSRSKIVLSPYPFGMSDDDNLRVTAVNSVAGVVVNVHTRRILKDLTPTADTPSFTPASDRTVTSVDVRLAGGYVTNLSVFASGATPKKGQCFVIVQMIRGMGISATVLGTLLAGYITATQPIGWPGSPIESSTDGEPVVRQIVGTSPGVGNNIVETVPTGARWELLSFTAKASYIAGAMTTFIPQVNVADNGGNVLGHYPAAVKWQGNVDAYATFAANYNPPTPVISDISGALPGGLKLLAGATLTMPVVAGVWTWNAPVYSVREWQEAA